jgi:hypothetical protein
MNLGRTREKEKPIPRKKSKVDGQCTRIGGGQQKGPKTKGLRKDK